MAAEAKDKGNAAFSKGNYEEAVQWFTEGIKLDPSNHILYSNRSASYCNLKKYAEALTDADKTVQLKADWGKGYSRKGAALYGLKKFVEAEKAYREGLKVEPNNEQLKQGLADVEKAMEPEGGDAQDFMKSFGQLWSGDVLGKLRMNPQTAAFCNQPDFVNAIQDLQKNPKNLNKYMGDQRIMSAGGVLLGIPIQTSMPDTTQTTQQTHTQPMETPKETPKQPEKTKNEPTPMETEASQATKKAEEFKNKGNEAYKNKKFEEAVAFYNQAYEAEPNITYVTNRAAAFYEMGKLEECIADCEKAIQEGRAQRADYKQIAKAYARMGNAYMKQELYDQAIEAYNKSLTEDRIPATLQLLQKAEKIKQEKEKLALLDPQKSLEHKEKGNQLFKEGKFPEALKEYSEAIKRNPSDHVLYSNRAACYTKLAEYNLGLKDCDECIRLKPDFPKVYVRKGHLHFFMKEYEKALNAYDKGIELDPNNQECSEGAKRCIETMSKTQTNQSEEEILQNAAKNPEIQEILSDPAFRVILEQIQKEPKALQDHLKHPGVRTKLQKLMAAGILRVSGSPNSFGGKSSFDE